MSIKGKHIGIAITGSFCTINSYVKSSKNSLMKEPLYRPFFLILPKVLILVFGTASDFMEYCETITGNKPILTIPQAEPIGPKGLFDILVLFPCTGNTIAKLANGITDTPVLMVPAKAHLRNNKPLLISISTNDALGMNMKNIGLLLNTKHIYFVPFLGQDNPEKSPIP